MDRIVDTSAYGICLFSLDKMSTFLKEQKVKNNKALKTLQKKDKLFILSQKEGAWLPIAPVNGGKALVKIEGFDEDFSDEWEKKFEYDGFNLDIKDGLWVSDIGAFLDFDESTFCGEGTEVKGDFGIKKYYSNKVKWYETLDGKRLYSAFKYEVPEGKYLISIIGYLRKDKTDIRAVKYGYCLKLAKVDEFNGYLDPREDKYDFGFENIR